MTKLTFNTGRLYTADGQLVTLEYNRDTRVILFNDHSRMLAGSFDYQRGSPSERDLIEATMTAYDHMLYRHDAKAYTLEPSAEVIPIIL